MKNFIIKMKIMENVIKINKNWINSESIFEFKQMFFDIFKSLLKINEKIEKWEIKCMEIDDYYALVIYGKGDKIIAVIFWDFDLLATDDWQRMIKHDYRFDGCTTMDDVLSKYH